MKIQVCTGASCKAKFSDYIIKRIERDIEKFDLKNIEIEKVNCM
jgi:NADH:ubiquinone oxidoreductase subunit E